MSSNHRVFLTISPNEAFRDIHDHVEFGEKLLKSPISNLKELAEAKNEYRKWRAYATTLLNEMFTSDAIANELRGGAVIISPQNFQDELDEYRERFRDDLTTLESIEQRIPLFKYGQHKTPTDDRVEKAKAAQVGQIFNGPVGMVAGVNKSRMSSGHNESDGKGWQLFLALLGVAGALLVSYLAYKFHWAP